jgi:RNA polymerase sigma-70 factor (ECF subfamily)
MAHDQATPEDLLAHATWMRGLARRLLGDRDEAEDVVQEAWLSALRVPPERGRTLRPWIATVMLNLVRTRSRRGARTRAREQLFGAPDPAPSAEEVLVQRQIERQLAEEVLALDEPYRRTILLRFHDGLSSAEIARDEGIAEGTVRWRLKYGLDQLRQRFGVGAEPGGTGMKALGALVPLAYPPGAAAPPPPVIPPPGMSWTSAGFLPGKAVLTAAGAVAAVTAVAVGVRHRPARPPVALVAPAQAATSPARDDTPADDTVVTDNDIAAAPTPLPPETPPPPRAVAPPALTPINGIVRDSRGLAAAHVPVTLRRLGGSGAADLTTVTDEAGRFRYQLQSHSSFLLTAEIPGEPAARLEIEVPARLALSLDASTFTSQASTFGTIDVALGSRPARAAAAAAPRARRLASLPPTRWCCRDAFEVGEVVYGRACLKFDDGSRAQQSGCDLYQLRKHVSCQHRIHGGVSTGDLSRTEQLDCDGRVL